MHTESHLAPPPLFQHTGPLAASDGSDQQPEEYSEEAVGLAMQALAERLTQRDMDGKDNIAEVFIDGLRSCVRGEEDEFVDTFLEDNVSEALRRDLRPVFAQLARALVPVLRAAKSGFYLQLVLGLVFTYTDMALDVHTSWLFLELGLYGTGWAGIGIIGLSLVVQALASLLLFKQGWKEALWALVGAKPVMDVRRIITGAPPHRVDGVTWSHESILAATKLCEATFENMPQALLQQSLDVLRGAFSAVVQKSVYTFKFDRR